MAASLNRALNGRIDMALQGGPRGQHASLCLEERPAVLRVVQFVIQAAFEIVGFLCRTGPWSVANFPACGFFKILRVTGCDRIGIVFS